MVKIRSLLIGRCAWAMLALGIVMSWLSSARAADYEVITSGEAAMRGAAAGGDEVHVIDNGDYTFDFVHIFTSGSGTLDFTSVLRPVPDSLRLLVVGGGGSGGQNCGGGGGAGELIELTDLPVPTGTASVTVGTGGAAVANGAAGSGSGRGYDGTPSTLTIGGTTYTARGGGGGGSWNSRAGRPGGSGGGSSGYNAAGNDSYRGATTAVAPGVGSRGGYNISTDNTRPAGGGGGAGGEGGNGTGTAASAKSGAGGDGVESDISGESAFYAGGGGGGGANSASVGNLGGSGVGGNGTGSSSNGGAATAGAPNTGSGGGGGAGGSTQAPSGAGADGVVIVRYTVRIPVVFQGVEILQSGADVSMVETASGTELVLKYTNPYDAGSLVLPGYAEAWILAVGGGGAGANPATALTTVGGAAGGGAGGFVEKESIRLEAGSYTIQVGRGGEALAASTRGQGGDGAPSYIRKGSADLLLALGGGGGGMSGAGRPGGSGGGGSKAAGGVAQQPTSASGGFGYAGGAGGTYNESGAGGGGAGGAGAAVTKAKTGSDGGPGRASEITGESVIYAAGGGGGSRGHSTTASTGGLGGSGIGGNGGYGTSNVKTSATAGRDGTGSGGGGGCYNQAGGAGGSGVVIIRIRLVTKPIEPIADNQSFEWRPEGYVMFEEDATGILYDLSGTWAATNVASYAFTVTPKPGIFWSDDQSTAPRTYHWKITEAAIEILDFALDGWQAGTPAAEVVLKTNPQIVLSDAVFSYQPSGSGTWTTIKHDQFGSLTEGEYLVKVEIPDKPGLYSGASHDPIPVRIWSGDVAGTLAVPGLGYRAKLSLATALEADTNLLVALGPDLIEGFGYNQAYPDGSDVRFAVRTGDALTVLPSTIAHWVPDGTSLATVEVPAGTTELIVAWGPLAGEPLPEMPALSAVSTPLHHYAFEKSYEDLGSGTRGTQNALSDNHTPVYLPSAYPDLDLGAMTAGTPYTENLNFPASGVWALACRAKASPTLARTVLFSLGPRGTRGLALATSPDGTAAIYTWTANGTATPVCSTTVADIATAYHTYVLKANGTAVTLWVDGAAACSGTVSAAFNSNTHVQFNAVYGGLPGGNLTRFGIDAEIDDWCIYADSSADGLETMTYSPSIVRAEVVAGEKLLANFWQVPPVTPPTVWGTGLEPTIDLGTLAYGVADFVITSVGGEAWTNAFPTAAGSYALTWEAPGGSWRAANWAPFVSEPVTVLVEEHTPVTGLAGTAGSATLSGRVLLANNEPGTEAPIADQDYGQTAETSPAVYWVHDEAEPPSAFPNFRPGVTHRLMAGEPVAELNNATTIWTMSDVYLGTTYNASANVLLRRLRNLLPFSATSAADPEQAMHLVMRNAIDAQVVSPCYRDGVGTVYFDAVNDTIEGAAGGNNLVVETVTGSDALLPAIPDEKWSRVELQPILRDTSVSSDFVALDPTSELDMAITNGQYAADSFYRVVARVETHEPVRFRIRRTTVPTMPDGNDRYDLDAGGFILLDNIVVSYPAMRADLEGYGIFDPTRSGKQALGYEGAWNVPFPATGDELHPRAKAKYYTNPGYLGAETNRFITAANLHYRWRYLDQQVNAWSTPLPLDPATLSAPDTLNLKNANGDFLPGDVEFWYDVTLNAPFYKYVDYAGVAGFDMAAFYSEEIRSVTNRASGVTFASGGTDWFIRLREGRSNFEGLNLVVRDLPKAPSPDVLIDEDGLVTRRVPMELVGNHIWRGYLKTTVPTNSQFRIELLNEQVPGSAEWATNVANWVAQDVKEFPVSEVMSVGTTNSWAHIPVDATTGYLMFQVDDSTRSITVVRADYMNFNGWNDAKKDVFVGTSTEDEAKSGVSHKAREMKEDFANWNDMIVTKPEHWSESFSTTAAMTKPEYQTFASDTTLNGWQAGQGMYVYGNFRDDQNDQTGMKNRALQMEGQGRGFIQLVDAADAPRGLESINFTARMGQFINFEDFCFYDAPNKAEMKNYTFTARGTYDLANMTSFSGNASLSLVAYYRQDVGCYEFRLEQTGATRNKGVVTGAERRYQTLSLYKWQYDLETGKMNKTLLGAQSWKPSSSSGEGMTQTTSLVGSFCPMYISVSNDVSGATLITAGIKKANTGIAGNSVYTENANQSAYFTVCFKDATDPLTSGTYGMVTANSSGYLQDPFMIPSPIPFGKALPGDNKFTYYDDTLTFPNTRTVCLEDMYYGRWKITPGRMELYCTTQTNTTTGVVTPYEADRKWGLKARKLAPQEIQIFTAPAGTANWGATPIAVTNVATFGTSTSSGTRFSFPLYTTQDCSVKIVAAGSVDDVRRDVVIDDIELRQFRGANWEHVDVQQALGPSWPDESLLRGHTNFIFAAGWITNHAVRLSAKRTRPGEPSALRSPIFDDSYGRGTGLGMISFNYRKAQANTKLLVQIATNDLQAGDFPALDKVIDETVWTTVTNYTFTANESGTKSCYFGLHGVAGAMRILVDPEVVSAVANEKNPDRFGEIEITDVFCRDEPVLDQTSWWGWNLRTVDQDVRGAVTNDYRYLPDASSSDLTDRGLSLALNDSVTRDIDPTTAITYRQHLPFVQTPTFATNIVGEVSFRARKYDAAGSQPAQITVFGSRSGDELGEWTRMSAKGTGTEGGVFIVSNNTYTTYSLKTNPGDEYRAFRLVVSGVEGASDPQMGNRSPEGYDHAVRVLIDEVLVSEAVRARVGFRNVGAFRSEMSKLKEIPGVPGEREQPLCGEGWGIQCEVYPAQLPDEVDFASQAPMVKLYWYEGEEPWGFSNWKTNRLAKSAWLSRVPTEDGRYVYRSTYAENEGASVIPAVTRPGTTVQYSLEVYYRQVGQEGLMMDPLLQQDWVKPIWYDPVDYQEKYGRGKGFAAYCILDTVAPHWAWFNEVNIFGGYDKNWANEDKDNQYIEIATPADADISGWFVNALYAEPSSGVIVTNMLAMFGQGIPGRRDNLIGAASNMVFRVLVSQKTAEKNELKAADGRRDGVWSVSFPTASLSSDGEINYIYPVGLQLVRGSGIVEHEVVGVGYNLWKEVPDETQRMENDPTNVVNFLNRTMTGAHFIFSAEDEITPKCSVGVVRSRGELTDHWSNTMAETPGRINEGQQIDGEVPTPNGEEMTVRFNLDLTTGPIVQTIGDAVLTNTLQILSIQKGKSTNVTYRVGTWHDIGNVTMNGQALTPVATRTAEPREGLTDKEWTFLVGGPAYSNNLTVVAAARVRDDIAEQITDPRFREAIVDWLSGGRTLRGPFAGATDELKLADYVTLNRQSRTPMTLTEMYWLDIDPTVGGIELVAGISDLKTVFATNEVHTAEFDGEVVQTNVLVDVTMMLTNATADAADPGYGMAWRPYVIRGMEPGATSLNRPMKGWTNATFKITGVMNNGYTDIAVGSEDYLPVCWYTFDEDSFGPETGAKPFTATIEVSDPHSPLSPGYEQGWKNFPDKNLFYGWALDMRLRPYEVLILKKENLLPRNEEEP